ncbi:hypothetical protein BGX34_001570 [Mortierella sp. NVP85]|nr:hypothetical protein BGX34_001570 [Mortierella sp. NVP85]
MAPTTNGTKFEHKNGARLICLDGGGVRGIASLIMLDEIMKRIQKRRGLPELPRPADYFELAAGTSTGGIIAIMLFRLHMTTQQAIDEYKIISKQVFQTTLHGWDVPSFLDPVVTSFKTFFQRSCFDPANLDKAIDSVMEKYGLDENDKKLKGKAPLDHKNSRKVFVCTTAQNRGETALLRSYRNNIEVKKSVVNDVLKVGHDQIDISLAVRATSAAPTYFPEVSWQPKGAEKPLIFWDGGLLNNNPIDQLWYARCDVVEPTDPEPPISCVISFGTGYIAPKDTNHSWSKLFAIANSVIDFATNTNAKGKDFSRHMCSMNLRPGYANTKYVRFDPDLDGNDIGLADYKKIDLLIELANKQLKKEREQAWIETAVNAICPSD